MSYTILMTAEYKEWLESEVDKSKFQIQERIRKIETENYFGTHKNLGDEIWELKWRNGRRVYYSYIPKTKILLLLGGNKNGQKKDINKSKKIYKSYIKKGEKRGHD